MKILLVSDSHGDDLILKELKNEYPDMDHYLHAGDSQSSEYAIFPFDSISGNCDCYPFDERRKIYTPIGYLLMKHYPHLFSNEKEGIKIFVHGHTHKWKISKEGEMYIICPGSISRPRDGTLGTYAILDLNEKESSVMIIEVETKNILKRMKLM